MGIVDDMGSMIVLGSVICIVVMAWAYKDIKMGDRYIESYEELLDILERMHERRDGDLEAIGNMVRKIVHGFDNTMGYLVDEDMDGEMDGETGYHPQHEDLDDEETWIARQMGTLRLADPSPPSNEELKTFIPHEDDPFMDDGVANQ